jgi:ribonucleoside-diphosphate reductase beta chain
MSRDVAQWRAPGVISDGERLLLTRCLGFFAGAESLVSNNLLLSIFRVVRDAECRQYILRQAYEEALHNQTVVYICDSLGLDVATIYEAYRNIPAIRAKDEFLLGITADLARPDFTLATDAGRRAALRTIITYYVVCEGVMFYSGFAMLLSFGRQNKMPGMCEQIQYTLRDESVHVKFGVRLIREIVAQEPDIWTEEFRAETVAHILTAVELEDAYVRDALPAGVLGLNADLFRAYQRFIACRRLEALGLPVPADFARARNPFPWLTETIDLVKQKNFFETRVTEYAVGSLRDDF